MLDNERCILCSRCVRFTREISKSHALGVQNRGDHSLIRAGRGRRLRARSVLRQRHRHLPGGRAAVAALPAQGARVVPEAHAVGLPGLRARLQHQHLAPQERVEAQGARSRRRTRASTASRRWRTRRSTARGSATRGATWRRSSSARVPSSRCARASRRAADGARRGARALIAAARRPVALVSNWASNEELAAFNAALGAALQQLRQDRLAAAARRARRGRSADQRRQEPQQRRRTRALPAAARRSGPGLPCGHRPGAGLGRGLRLRRSCRPDANDHLPRRLGCSPRTAAPTCSSRSACRPSVAATTRTSQAW